MGVQGYEAPDFSGMSPDAFIGGGNVVDSYRSLDPPVRLESAQHILRAIGYETPIDEADLGQLEAIAQAAAELAERAKKRARALIDEQSAPVHLDLDY